jgi:protein-tyrosine phosphatase
VIDLHCHVLPGIDDGPATPEEALALARAFLAEGITRVTATPHVSPGYSNSAATIAARCSELVSALARAQLPLEVVPCAEIDLLHGAALGEDELAAMTLGRGDALLVECPFAPVVPSFEALIARLQDRGHRVVLAHPERSPAFTRDHDLLRRLVHRGALSSLTGASLAGDFGRTAQRYACWALDEGLAHNVATDAHGANRRMPVLRGPLEEAGYGWAAEWLTVAVPEAVLSGAPLPSRPSPPATGGGALGWWRRTLAGGAG